MNDLINPIRGLINSLDWNDPNYSLSKAFVCCSLANLAYRNLSDNELRDIKRVKERINIIPSGIFQNIVNTGGGFDFESALRSADIGKFFVVNKTYASVVGIFFPEVIFIAIRGTVSLYDWAVNLNFKKYHHERFKASYHLGFYRAIASCLTPISDELQKLNYNGEIPIYVTGHSLGGAMAGIFNTIWSYQRPSPSNSTHFHPWGTESNSCYTFGMPRFGDMAAMELKQLYNFYNEKDIVPTIPPRSWGFENSLNEYSLDGKSIENISKRDSISYLKWITRLFLGQGIKNHNAELYLSRIAELWAQPTP